MLKTVKIASYEMGLRFRGGEFKGLLAAGRHWLVDPLLRTRVKVVSQRDPWLVHDKLDVIVKSGALKERAVVLDLKDHERALVWIDGRFSHVLPPGLYAYWTGFRGVTVETVDARSVRFGHKDLHVITRSPLADRVLEVLTVEPGHAGVLYVDGAYADTLPPGRHVFWKNVAKVTLVPVDLREAMHDVAGQEIMTADKVTLRLNAVVTYRVRDALQVVNVTDDARQALYREAQLALRAVVGTRASVLGFELIAVGIRDVILPGEMKTLLNRVIEAKKAAEANLIVRREETAAIRSQANTAKLLEENPTLMRLRELEILEKVAASSKLNVVLGEKGLAERVVNLL